MRIAIISGSRADEGPLEMVDAKLHQHDIGWLDVSVSAPRDTYQAMKITIDCLSADPPDLVILLGDRYEILGAAVAANVMGIPIAHLSGGDVTEGSQDDCYRHAITKLAHLHFPTSWESADRIIQMGEQPDRVHMVGCPGIDRILNRKRMSKPEALKAVGLALDDAGFALGCLHPNTFGNTEAELREFLDYLKALHPEMGIVLIGPNQDAGNEIIRAALKAFTETRPLSVYHDAVEGQIYLSLIKHCSIFVGNSAALYYEAPTLGAHIKEIGDRQKGRKNHRGDGHAAERIAAIISKIDNPRALLRKRFHNITARAGVSRETVAQQASALNADFWKAAQQFAAVNPYKL